tara:strand:- start:485 stop:1600 length:1116 start_codon:yes stop_codon:yes gene_type:complete
MVSLEEQLLANSFEKVFMGAAGSGGPSGSYIALAHSTSPYFTLLDHTTPGSVSEADTYTLNGIGRAVGFSPDGNYIGVANSNVHFKILDHTTAGSVSLESTSQSLTSDNIFEMAFSPNGTYIAVGFLNKVSLLNYSNPSSVSNVATHTFSPSANTVRGLDFSPDGNYLAVAHQGTSSSAGSQVRFTLLDHTSAGSLSVSDTHSINAAAGDYFGPYSVAFSPVGDYIAVGASANNAFGESINRHEVILLDHTSAGSVSAADTFDLNAKDRAMALAFSPDGNYLAVGHNQSPFFTLLDHTSAGSLSAADTQVISANGVEQVVFSPDGKYIAIGHNSTTSTKFTLLDHTTAGSVSISDTFTGTGIVYGVSFSAN